MGGTFESVSALEQWLEKQKQELDKNKEIHNPLQSRTFLPWSLIKERLVFREMRLDDEEGINEAFTYHAPNDEQKALYNELRPKFKALALDIIRLVPQSATRTAALRMLWETSMIANAAIATEGKI